MDLAASLGVARPTVGRWRSRFIEGRLGGLVDEDRPGAPRKVTDEQVVAAALEPAPESIPESALESALESIPKDATHWSRTSMAKRCALSKSTAVRIWTAFRRKPHRSETLSVDRCSSGTSATESYMDRW
jgi:transposase-like protein